MFEKLKSVTKTLKREVQVYQLVIKDKRTPKVAKILLGIAVGYALLPFDIIPDFIPVIGHLDDAIILSVLVFAASKIIPKNVIDDCRKKVIKRTYSRSVSENLSSAYRNNHKRSLIFV